MLQLNGRVWLNLALASSIFMSAFSNQRAIGEQKTECERTKHSIVREEQVQKSLIRLDNAIKQTPNNSQAFFARGLLYSELGKLQSSLTDFTSAIINSPKYYEAYISRAEVFSRLGMYQQQIDDLTSAININSNNFKLYENRGYALYLLGKLEDSLHDCRMAMQLNPTAPASFATAAEVYEGLGQYNSAIEKRTKLLSLTQNSASNFGNRARDYAMIGNLAQAQTDLQQASELATANERTEMEFCSPFSDYRKMVLVDPKVIIDRQLSKSKVDLSFHYMDGSHICVPAQVNGCPLMLILDTGSAHSNLGARTLFKIAQKSTFTLRGTNANGHDYCHEFLARELKLGDLILPDVLIDVRKDQLKPTPTDGFLSGNILENFVVTINYATKKVTLANSPARNASAQAISVPMTIYQHCPACTVTLDEKHSVTALLDSGASANIAPDALISTIIPRKLTYKEQIDGPWLGRLESESIRLKDLKFGNFHFAAPIFSVFRSADAPYAASKIILGNSFLSQFKTVTFDYPGRRVVLEPEPVGVKSAQNTYQEARFFSEHNQPFRALEGFGRAMLIDRELTASCYYARAVIFANLKRYQKAILELNALIKLDSKNAWFRYLRAWSFGKLGNYAHQITEDTSAIRLDPQLQAAYRDRASAYEKTGKHASAERDRRISKKLSTN